jgi:hypothetical protein
VLASNKDKDTRARLLISRERFDMTFEWVQARGWLQRAHPHAAWLTGIAGSKFAHTGESANARTAAVC